MCSRGFNDRIVLAPRRIRSDQPTRAVASNREHGCIRPSSLLVMSVLVPTTIRSCFLLYSCADDSLLLCFSQGDTLDTTSRRVHFCAGSAFPAIGNPRSPTPSPGEVKNHNRRTLGTSICMYGTQDNLKSTAEQLLLLFWGSHCPAGSTRPPRTGVEVAWRHVVTFYTC